MFDYSSYKEKAEYGEQRAVIPDGTICMWKIELLTGKNPVPGKSPYLSRGPSGIVGFTMLCTPIGTQNNPTRFTGCRMWQWFAAPESEQTEKQTEKLSDKHLRMIKWHGEQMKALLESGNIDPSFKDLQYLNGKVFCAQVSARPDSYERDVKDDYGTVIGKETVHSVRYRIKKIILPNTEEYALMRKYGELSPKQVFAIRAGKNPKDPEFMDFGEQPAGSSRPQAQNQNTQDVPYYQNQSDDYSSDMRSDNVPF